MLEKGPRTTPSKKNKIVEQLLTQRMVLYLMGVLGKNTDNFFLLLEIFSLFTKVLSLCLMDLKDFGVVGVVVQSWGFTQQSLF